jgi:alpha-tubulin suppressor-like RCC1 family protein
MLVPGDGRFTDLAVGSLSVCGLDAQRDAFCWGANLMGEVGDGSHVAKRHPTRVVGGLLWQSIAAGSVHFCGIVLSGKTYCWGNQFRGALGNGKSENGSLPLPAPISGDLGFSRVYGGSAATCGLTAAGEAFCWGANDNGKLGDGTTPELSKELLVPSKVVGNLSFASLSLGGGHTCGTSLDKRGFCWGTNTNGQLGNGATTHSSTPLEVSGGNQWASISAGLAHSCGLTVGGSIYCWGLNDYGQLGNGSTQESLVPVAVSSQEHFAAVVAGEYHTCGLASNGVLYCWGRGDYGQLGNGMTVNQTRPVAVIR